MENCKNVRETLNVNFIDKVLKLLKKEISIHFESLSYTHRLDVKVSCHKVLLTLKRFSPLKSMVFARVVARTINSNAVKRYEFAASMSRR